MPQMMPMMWSLMFIFIILTSLTTISFFFFINMPNILSTKPKSSTFSYWSWTW